MLRRARSVLAWIIVVALACGNGVSAVAGMPEHLPSERVHVLSGEDAAGQRGHGHKHSHHHSGKTAADADRACPTDPCPSGDDPDEPCCTFHAQCCVSIGLLPAMTGLSLFDQASQRHSSVAQTFLLGDLLYPVLRPPRLLA